MYKRKLNNDLSYISVGLLAAAVGIAGHLNSLFSSICFSMSNMKIPTKPGYDISLDVFVGFPWSILLSGTLTHDTF